MNKSNALPQICSRCVMDTSDSQIFFDKRGYCNHCIHVEKEILNKRWFPEGKHSELNKILDNIRKDGKGKSYDCIIGLSGGVDSSYLAYLVVKEFGLRPLAVHVDAGWNSEIAVSNIENIIRKLNIDLYTEVINWEEIQDLQRAYIRSGIANQDVPQDHAFSTILYQLTKEKNIKYFLSGDNFATESILPTSWGHDSMDSINLRAIHRKFGERPLKKYPIQSLYKRYIYYNFLFKLQKITPLNYVNYERDKAIDFLQKELGWKNYGDKHHESRWTKWFQNHYLPKRFGYDKRRAHLSSMIMSGGITRKEALDKLKIPLYEENARKIDEDFIIKKLKMKEEEFKKCFRETPRSHLDFASNNMLILTNKKIKKIICFLKVRIS